MSHTWQVVGASVRGAAHRRRGLPNQDAIHWSGVERAAGPLVLAVSDGHGSAKCFRSDAGAQLGVRVATRVVSDALASPSATADLALIERLAHCLASEWRAAVTECLRRRPLEESELAALERKDGAAARQAVERHPALAYGATLLIVAATEQSVLYLQLGDGDILAVWPDGRVERPLLGDARLFADQTTSLCSPAAATEFRVGFHTVQQGAAHAEGPNGGSDLPAMVVVSSDGYGNSFKDDHAFRQVGSDLLEMISSEGTEAIGPCLPEWLEEASRLGSGDDVTVGILVRGSGLHPQPLSHEERGECCRTEMEVVLQ